MKYLKILGLAAIAAAALMAFAGTASATVLTGTGCAESGCGVGTEIKSESEGHAILDAPFGNIECNSSVSGKISNSGSSSETVKGSLEEATEGKPTDQLLTFFNCTREAKVVVLKSGSLEIHTQNTTPNNNGTLTSTGAEVTVEYLGTHCIFGTNGTSVGTVTGSANTAGGATLDISATIPRIGGRSGIFCGSSAPWTGSYKVTSQEVLNVD